VTVCIAAICTFRGAPMVLATSDQMITSEDIEYQQPQPKGLLVSNHVIAMFFGNAVEQVTVALAVKAEAIRQNESNMALLAELYAHEYARLRRRRAEAAILEPLGLDTETFLSRQHALDAGFVADVTHQLQDYHLDRYGGAILAGVDSTGAHIYHVGDPGMALCMDRFGFVAGGGGRWHAESQFMFAGYVPMWDFERALLLIYSAKKRAEVAPGVGDATDLVAITSRPPELYYFGSEADVVKKLETVYQEGRQEMEQVKHRQEENVRAYVQKVLAVPPAQSQPPAALPETPKRESET
jgi:hypothetical protein